MGGLSSAGTNGPYQIKATRAYNTFRFSHTTGPFTMVNTRVS